MTKLNKETFPKGNVWIREAGVDEAVPVLVLGIYNHGITFGSIASPRAITCFPWKQLVEEGEYSTDGRETWTKFSEKYV